MKSLEDIFVQELHKSLSLKVDLRTYEDFIVKTEDGKVVFILKFLTAYFFFTVLWSSC